MDLDKAIKERKSVRNFSTKSVSYRKIMDAVNAANYAPKAGNINTCKFIIVSDREEIKKLAKASQQDFIAKADWIVAVCSDTRQIEVSYEEERGKRYGKQQAGAAIENFLLKITDLGLATCWVGAFDDEEVRRALQLPDYAEVEAIFPIGYEMPPKSKQRKKPALEEVVYFDVWGNKMMRPFKKLET
jgi:nitroreductase